MDKYEYKIRADEIKELISQGEYVRAAEIADTIDWRRVKSVMMLCTISDLYKINRRYEDARDMLLLAYERRPGGRTICYSLCELSIKMEEFVQAIEYYKEFVQVAPKDAGRYILQYKLYEAQDVSLEERIAVLEELKKRDYREKWAYELAYMYHRVGLAARCVEECDELILWFGEGKYVIKAMELKMLHQPLTPSQQEKYNQRFVSVYEEQQDYQQQYEPQYEQQVEENAQSPYPEQDWTQGAYEDAQLSGDTQIYEAVTAQEQMPIQEEEVDIHVKTMDVGEYNTINLQAELAAGLREVLAEDSEKNSAEAAITRTIVAPMMDTDSDTETLDYPEIDEVSEDDLEPETEVVEETEVFFGETGEIGSLLQEQTPQTVPDITAEIVMEQLRQENAAAAAVAAEPEVEEAKVEETKVKDAILAEPPKELAEVLSQQPDGQISFVMPESENIEKQITGQMNIEDILAEWERMKQQNQEKRQEEVRQHVLQQTGAMFTEFEAAVRDGLLEQLERNKDENTNLSVGEQASFVEEAVADAMEAQLQEEFAGAAEADSMGETWSEDGAENSAWNENDASTGMEVGEPAYEAVEIEGIEPAYEAVASEYEAVESEYITDEAEASEVEIPETEEIIIATDEVEELEEIAEDSGEITENWDAPEEMMEDNQAEEQFDVEEPEIEELEAEESEVEELEATEDTSVIERDKPKVRALTREEKELFAPFIQSKSAREQLVKVIDNISMAAYTGNVIITGEEGMDTMSLAKNVIREVQSTDSNFSGKVAKISGQALNTKDTAATIEQLQNGALIISKASDMNRDTVKALHKVLQKESLGIVVVLEDTKKAMDKFLTANEELKESFNARMNVEALSNDTLVAFGKQYAREREFAIDELGILALHTRIEDMQTIDHAVTVIEVKEMIDEAIHHAKRKTLGHFFDVLFGKRYDEEDMIILTEKDFV